MKSLILATFAIMFLGLNFASAATTVNTQVHRPNDYNWLAGGGG
jgi:hypothetical protein